MTRAQIAMERWGEECPVRLVEETRYADAAKKQPLELSSQKPSHDSRWSHGCEGSNIVPPLDVCSVSWPVMRAVLEDSHNLFCAMDLMRAIWMLDKRFTGLYEVMKAVLQSSPRKWCHKDCRGLPQLVPTFPAPNAEGRFVEGAWYFYRRKCGRRFVVVQVLSTRTSRGKERLRIRILYERSTQSVWNHLRWNHSEEFVEIAAEPREIIFCLPRVSGSFEKTSGVNAGTCKCCGELTPHRSIIVGGATVCARSRVQRGGVALQ